MFVGCWFWEGSEVEQSTGEGWLVDSVEVRRERDGKFRYSFTVGEQLVVSRESYATEAEAVQAGEAVSQRTGRWVQPEDTNSD